MTKQTMIAGFVLVAAVGCGGSGDSQTEQAAEQMQQGSEQVQQGAQQMAQAGTEQMAQGLQQMTQGLQQMAQNQAEVVDYEILKGVLPASVSGWTQSGVRGEQTSMPLKVSRAEARYSRGDSSVELEITDTALNQMLLAPVSMFISSGFSERSDDGFKRSTTFGDQPGMEDWNSRSRRGEVTAIVDNRFIIKATGRDVEDLAAVRQIVEAVDFSKLAGLQ